MKTFLSVLKSILFALVGLTFSFTTSAQIYQFTDNSSGTPFAIATNATGGNLTRGAGLLSPSSCISSSDGFGSRGFATSSAATISTVDADGDFVSFTITPNAGYRLNITGFTANLRSPSGGPTAVRYSYTIGGGSFVQNGESLTPGTSTSCGNVGLVGAWTSFSPILTTETVTFKIYGFNGSGGDMHLKTVTVAGTVECNPAIVSSVTPVSSAICLNNTVTLTGGTSGGTVPTLTNTWSIESGGSGTGTLSSPTTNISNLFTGTGSGNVFVKYTASYGSCVVASPKATMTVDGFPTITLGANPAVCLGATSASLAYSATTNSPSTYTINFDATAEAAGFVDISNQTLDAAPGVFTIPTASIAAGVYNATVVVEKTSTGCESVLYPITVTIYPLPSVSIAGSSSVCEGATTTLTGTAPTAVSSNWITPPPFASVNSSGVVSGLSAGATIITYSITDVNGCVNTAIHNITVNARPTSGVIAGTTTICSGQSTNLTVTIAGGESPYTVVYTDGTSNFTESSYVSATNISISPTTTKTYTIVSVTDVNGCTVATPSGSAVVTVNPSPTAGILSGTATICSDASTNLSVAVTGGIAPFTVVYNNGALNIPVNSYISGADIL